MKHLYLVHAIVLVFVLVSCKQVRAETPGGCRQARDVNVWLLKTGGHWEDGDAHGHFRVLVVRKGVEHAIDSVRVQVTRTIDAKNKREIVRCVDLGTPELKGYVEDVGIVEHGEKRAAIYVDISMKAMEDLVLREVFIVSSNGKVKKVVNADYIDLFDEPIGRSPAKK